MPVTLYEPQQAKTAQQPADHGAQPHTGDTQASGWAGRGSAGTPTDAWD